MIGWWKCSSGRASDVLWQGLSFAARGLLATLEDSADGSGVVPMPAGPRELAAVVGGWQGADLVLTLLEEIERAGRVATRLLRLPEAGQRLLAEVLGARRRGEVLAVRRRRAHRAAGSAPQQGSLALAIQRLKHDAVPFAALVDFFEHAQISPVLTAHPTEVQRKSILDAERAIAELVGERDDLHGERERRRGRRAGARRYQSGCVGVLRSRAATAHRHSAAAAL